MELARFTDDHTWGEINDLIGEVHSPIPSHRRVTLEQSGTTCIVNICLGSKGNIALAQFLSSMISARLGASVGSEVDPYRVTLLLPAGYSAERVKKLIMETPPESVGQIIRTTLTNSHELRYYLIHTAKKFGAIKRDSKAHHIGIRRLLESFKETIIFEEAMNKMLFERMEIEAVEKALEMLQSGEWELDITGLTAIGQAGLDMRKDLLLPDRPSRAILTALNNRLGRERMALVCISCRRTWSKTVRDIRWPTCDVCGSTLVAAVPEKQLNRKMIKEKVPKDQKRFKQLLTNANLVNEHGQKAAMTFAARGVGAKTAARILRGYHEDEFDLLAAILRAEIHYARTKRFWD